MQERDVRKSQPVLVAINGMTLNLLAFKIIWKIIVFCVYIGGPVVRLKGSVTSMSFLDAFGSIIPFSFEPWRDDSRDGKKERKHLMLEAQNMYILKYFKYYKHRLKRLSINSL